MGEETYQATSSLALTLLSGRGSFIVLEYTFDQKFSGSQLAVEI